MKKLMTITVLLIITALTQAQTLQGLFDKYADDERFEYVSVGKGMMNMASAFGGIAKNDKEMMSKMRGIKILTLEASSDSPLMKTLERDLKQVLAAGDFETAVETRDKGEKVNIYYRVSGGDNADMLIVTKEKSEFSMIWISGKMTKEEMMKSFSGDVNTINFHGDCRKTNDSIS